MDTEREVGKYLEYCKFRKELNGNTLKAYRIDLKQYISWIGNHVVEKAKIEEYITQLHKRYKQKTVKRKIASIKAFYKYLEEEEILTETNPFDRIKVKFKEMEVLPRIIPRGDIEALLNYMYSIVKSFPKDSDIYRDLVIIEVFFATGARVYEISNLRKENVNLNEGSIKIMGKGGKERYIQIANDDVLRLMRQYYEQKKKHIDETGYFFVNRRGSRFTEQSIRRMVGKYSQMAGITIHVTPHMFRHSVATYLLEEGVDIMFIQKILGHSSIKTTQIYLHLTSKRQAEILRVMHPRNKMRIQKIA